jgi:hypothetical protein
MISIKLYITKNKFCQTCYRQALDKMLQIGQNSEVQVHYLYIIGTINDRHCVLHKKKTFSAKLVTGDAEIDPMYHDSLSVMKEAQRAFFVTDENFM